MPDSPPPAVKSASALDARIAGSFRHRFGQELLRNSAQFPIANLLLEMLLEGWRILLAPDMYVLVAAALLQAWVITRLGGWPPVWRLVGNLVGPASYSAVEYLFEGAQFLASPNHVAYWCFGLALGLLQWTGRAAPGRLAGALLVAEHIVRTSILFAMYAIFEVVTGTQPFTPAGFFADGSHVFIALATVILGCSAALESRAGSSASRCCANHRGG